MQHISKRSEKKRKLVDALVSHVNISSFSLLPSLAKSALDMNNEVEGREVLIASAECAYVGV
jgi:hypothetical protein